MRWDWVRIGHRIGAILYFCRRHCGPTAHNESRLSLVIASVALEGGTILIDPGEGRRQHDLVFLFDHLELRWLHCYLSPTGRYSQIINLIYFH